MLSAFILALPTVILFRQEIEHAARPYAVAPIADSFLALEMTLILAAAIVTASALWWTWRLGLTRPEAVRVLFGATTPSPGWNMPRVARLLTPVTRSAVRAPDHDSTTDHRRAIAEIGKLLPSSQDSAARLSRISDSLVCAIEECDTQIASLSKVANAGELDRLTTQLAALEAETTMPSAERHQLGELVRQQLEVLRRMRLRCELIAQRRARLFSQLRGLWTNLEKLSVDPAAREDAMSGGRLVALCDEAEQSMANE